MEKFRGRVPEEVFTKAYFPPVSDGSGSDLKNLDMAKKLLERSGWNNKSGRLVNSETSKSMEIEFLLVGPGFERIVVPLIRNLEKIGIVGRIQKVDSVQYRKRLDEFDFDIVVATFRQSDSPGNEQRAFWGSVAARTGGSRNLIGINDSVVDALIDDIVRAPSRESLVAASRSLDRVLLWGHYVIPQWHIQSFRIAYWNRFGRPAVRPKYAIGLNTWWIDRDKDAALKRGKAAQRAQ